MDRLEGYYPSQNGRLLVFYSKANGLTLRVKDWDVDIYERAAAFVREMYHAFIEPNSKVNGDKWKIFVDCIVGWAEEEAAYHELQ